MIDARGLICPMPVVMTRNEIQKSQPDSIEILVDNRAAVENLTRFGTNCGYFVRVETCEEDYLVCMTRNTNM